ncbi:hypothetical protein RB653_001953 [Dictyostelium firmibasis]|uniref:Uncharacterized protein n=1 Tax=Dictyostelium firmibasis TaxID=79012 RepID=A0AAN7TVU1_9MYCE
MGLISLICDCIIVSTLCAGARRTTGLNIGQKVVGMIKNDTGSVIAKGFFNTGEWVADKGINYARNKIFQHKLNEFKDFKPNQTSFNNHQQQNNSQYNPQNNNNQFNNHNNNNNHNNSNNSNNNSENTFRH